jgi:hypothetical protein
MGLVVYGTGLCSKQLCMPRKPSSLWDQDLDIKRNRKRTYVRTYVRTSTAYILMRRIIFVSMILNRSV